MLLAIRCCGRCMHFRSQADPERVAREMVELFDVTEEEILWVSAKSGERPLTPVLRDAVTAPCMWRGRIVWGVGLALIFF